MDPRTSTVEITELANQELEGFVTCTLCKLIELKEEELKAKSSLRLSACVDVAVMQDEAGKLGYFVNEKSREFQPAFTPEVGRRTPFPLQTPTTRSL